MNHRDVMLARAKRARHKFLELPPEVQDEIVAGLDAQQLTEKAAEELAGKHGCEISGASIGRYYAALRRERALQIRREGLEQCISALRPVDADEGSQMFAKLTIDIAAEAILAAGSDLEKLKDAAQAASAAIHAVADLTRAKTTEKKVEAELIRLKGQEAKNKGEQPKSEEEMLAWIRERVYGLGS